VADRITANLPAKDFAATASFYQDLGFTVDFQDEGWMILSRGELELEFFPHPDLAPSDSWFSACVRVADVDALHRAWSQVGIPEQGIPRLTAPRDEAWGLRMFALVDPNGSLLRCMAPRPETDV
jgi:catechol 2,3-dioxygenase-like lactoylglutathione lyase family enzyme